MILPEPPPPRPCDYCGGWNIVDDGFSPRCQDADCTGEEDAIRADESSGKHHSFASFLAALFDGQDGDDSA